MAGESSLVVAKLAFRTQRLLLIATAFEQPHHFPLACLDCAHLRLGQSWHLNRLSHSHSLDSLNNVSLRSLGPFLLGATFLTEIAWARNLTTVANALLFHIGSTVAAELAFASRLALGAVCHYFSIYY